MTDFFEGKRILLLYGRFFHYDQIVQTKLISLGADVDLFDARAEINVIEKAIKKFNRSFYVRKQIQFHKGIQDKKASKQYDIIFSNCYLPKETVQGYKTTFPNAKFVLYLDDSVNNLKGVETTFSFYDRVVTFDRADALEYGIGFRPLFFVDEYNNNASKALTDSEEYDICFIGTCHSDRLRIIEAIEEECHRLEKKMFHYCYLQSPFMYLYYYLTRPEYRLKPYSYFSSKPLPTSKVASIMNNSDIILDIQHPNQTGLTMRTIETIGSRKKLITTNRDIINYDFYDPNNVLLIDRNNPHIDLSFFDKQYKELPKELYSYYSINGWIKDLFN